MDLTTTYLGLKLTSPIIPSSSPLWKDTDAVKKAEDAGAGAVVLYSIFEEQIIQEKLEFHHHLTAHTDSFSEAGSFFPEPAMYWTGAEEYLRHIEKVKKAVGIPVIASINGFTLGGWTEYAKKMEQAGADAVELNIYQVPTDSGIPGSEIEETYLRIVKSVKTAVRVPVAVKLSPYFSNTANMAFRLQQMGVDGLVLFNRFYQPDLDIENLEVVPKLNLSPSDALCLRIRWLAILYGHVPVSLAATGGIYEGKDAVKVILAGARAAMVCSAIFRHGIGQIRKIRQELSDWMKANEYESVSQMLGTMSQAKCENPSEYERAQYIRTLQSYKP